MNKQYVAHYGQLETTHWWFIVRQKILTQTVKKYISVQQIGKLKFLNVGAAAGASSKWLSAFGTVISIENDPLFFQCLKEQSVEVVNASVTALPFNKNEFDLVCAFDVIEHVADHEKALSELQRVCKPEGIICITVPAYQCLWSVHDEVNGHQRRYTMAPLKELLNTQKNNDIQYASYFNTILFIPIYLIRKLEKLFRKKRQNESSDFEYYKTNSVVNKLFQVIFGIEFFLLKLFRLPFGVSIIMVIKKLDNKIPSQV